MHSRVYLFPIFMLVAGGMGYLTAVSSSTSLPSVVRPELGSVAPFQFVDSTGAAFGSQNLAGKKWVLNFFFTSCHGPCPKLMTEVKKLVQESADDVHFVSITSDPETDTPEVLTRYRSEMGGTEPRWHFLTGKPDDVARFARDDLKFATGEPSLHTTKLILVDETGIIRGFFSSDSPEELARLREVLKSPRA